MTSHASVQKASKSTTTARLPPRKVHVAGAPPVVVNKDGLYQGQSWGWDGINKWAIAGGGYKELPFTNGWSPHNMTYLEMFTHFPPFAWLETILLVMTSMELERKKMAPLNAW